MNYLSNNEPRILSRQQVRAVDRIAIDDFGIQGVVLMENAGRGCAEILIRQQVTGPVVICCGKGNNGGDGFVIARHLANQRIPVSVILLAAPHELSSDASENLRILMHMQIPTSVLLLPQQSEEFASSLQSADWIVDALLGTGTTGEIRDPFRSAIEEINRAHKQVLAIDLPSGIDCDTGFPLGACVQATVTATFVGIKQGFQQSVAKPLLGEVHVVDIGAPYQAVEQAMM